MKFYWIVWQMASQDVFSIYYHHYGKDEIIANKRNKSAKYLTDFLLDYQLLDTNDDFKWLDNNSIRIDMMQDMSDHIFNNQYNHKSKKSRGYMARSLRFDMKYILINKIDSTTIRNVYAILI